MNIYKFSILIKPIFYNHYIFYLDDSTYIVYPLFINFYTRICIIGYLCSSGFNSDLI